MLHPQDPNRAVRRTIRIRTAAETRAEIGTKSPITTTAKTITETATNAEKSREINKVAESRVSLKGAERIDDLQRAGLKIIQDPERFCFGMDAVLLSHFAQVKKGGKVLDRDNPDTYECSYRKLTSGCS